MQAKKICHTALARLKIIKRFRHMSGNILRSVRKPKMSLEQLSEATGISTSQLSRFETEQRKPRVEDALRIAKALNVKVTDVFPEITASQSVTDTDIEALLVAVRKSYSMLGLDDAAADALLKLVLSRAEEHKAPRKEDGNDPRRQASQAEKSSRLKYPPDDQT